MFPAFKPLPTPPKVHDCTLPLPRKWRAPYFVRCVAEIAIGATHRRRRLWRGIRLCQGYDVTRATTVVAPGIERGELGFEEETDHATTE
jgi:hypothetical protein